MIGLDKLNQWLALVANIGVLVGIFFLVVEINQNTAAIRISTSQAMASEQAEFNRGFMDPDIARILVKVQESGYPSLTPVEKLQLNGFDNTWLFVQQNNYYQFRAGALAPGDWAGRHWGIVDVFQTSENMRIHWQNRGQAFGDEFRAYIERDVLPLVGNLTKD